MFRRFSFWVGLSLICLIIFFFTKRDSQVQVPVRVDDSHPVETPAPIHYEFKKTPKFRPRIVAQPSHSHENDKPDGNVIEFEVQGDLAIAYGDLILGKVDPAEPMKKGFYDAPNPKLWDKPEIPYVISPSLPRPERVEKAIQYLRENTPVNLIPYQGQPDAILFEKGEKACLSALGKLGGIQPIKLSEECETTEVLHEIMHSLGFIHEQSRPDRDEYIEVLWPNIQEAYRPQFIMAPDGFVEAIGN